jgi:hypothetical protein
MTTEEVVGVMGKPYSVGMWPLDSQRYWYLYPATFLHSDNFHVYFSTDDSVVVAIGTGD